MRLRNFCFALITMPLAWSCASSIDAPPFQDESASGVTFWIISPVQNEHVYSFHWDNDTLAVARSGESGLEYYDLQVDSCPLLGANLVQFRESILDSVEIVFFRKPAIPVTEVVMDSPDYRARYASDRFSTSVQLEGYEGGEVPWIAAARSVQERESACTGR